MTNTAKVDVLLGLQWGDEGKGKIVDVLAPKYPVIARFQGGPNAGHTLEFENKKYVLHTIPSGIFHQNAVNIIGNGVVIDPVTLQLEISKTGLSFEHIYKSLLISRKAHLILPSHRLLDFAMEQIKGEAKIGSTLKGIGPAYTDKYARAGLRIGDIEFPTFIENYEKLKKNHIQQAEYLNCKLNDFVVDNGSFSDYEKRWFDSIEYLKKLQFIDSEVYVNALLEKGMPILAEGAQGSLLDVDFGSYPFVTSSNTVAAGACSGLGIAPSKVGKVYGIFKAYCTRVGSGPFPTELFDEVGQKMRDIGREYGSTTGRPRRCGWLDLVALKYAVVLNGVTDLIMTKSDVLSSFETLKICTSYIFNGKEIDFIPYRIEEKMLQPVYKVVPGWLNDITNCRDYNDLPANLKEYVRFIEEFVNVPVKIISTGPDRTEIIYK
ncbi:MAG: adenylosuccinate synthase [Bacteroidetes bacterium]|nr:adenylosuccinate synthase [Bacteroidota bacterium]